MQSLVELFIGIMILYSTVELWSTPRIPLPANASTSVSDLTVRVDNGRFKFEVGIKAHVSNSSPQKSPGLSVMELKNPDLPPLVVELSSWPLITNSISFTGSPSRTMYVSLVLKDETRRSHIASRSWSSICEKKGTCNTKLSVQNLIAQRAIYIERNDEHDPADLEAVDGASSIPLYLFVEPSILQVSLL
ncbi:hypothetical protein RJ640_005255 [Escallonia rubra]|uniref:Uncharacterized protein n=1 Tax=Escallonia rubra TaxID=112253 RepID=A0AA88QQ36_9ASTE|nr:hypothetical protein RJ640_005255 [Escallonia rubra]